MIYADNAATTKLSKRALEAMLPFLSESYGNPSSIYSLGRNARVAVEEARETIARTLGADKNEIYFTGGGSEADNWAIKGACHFARRRLSKSHVITTVFEHHAVLHTMQALERDGFEITYVPVDENGLVNPSDVRAALRGDTALVSVMYANNEIGTVQPIAEIGAICREAGVLFHTDAVQAYGAIRIDVKKQNIDLLSVSAHKIHGPKGVGALYVRKGVSLENLIEGGAQERNRRAGTENTAGIVGFATAAAEAYENFDERIARITALRDKLIEQVLSSFERVRLNGDRYKRLPGNANFSFEGIEGEALLLMLDLDGICGSSGSACTSGSLDPSHVLLSIGLAHEIAHGSLRLSLSDENTSEEIDEIVVKLKKIVARLRQMSPVWEEIQRREGKRG